MITTRLRSHEDFGKRAHIYLSDPDGWDDFFGYLKKAFARALETDDLSHIATYFFSIEYLLAGKGHPHYQVVPGLRERTAKFLIDELGNIYRLTGRAHTLSPMARAQGLALLANFLPKIMVQEKRVSAKKILPVYLLCGHTLFETEFYEEKGPRALRMAQKGLFVWWAEDLLNYVQIPKPEAERDDRLKKLLNNLTEDIETKITQGETSDAELLWLLVGDFFWKVRLSGSKVDLENLLEEKKAKLWYELSNLCSYYIGEEDIAQRFRTFIEDRLFRATRSSKDQAPF